MRVLPMCAPVTEQPDPAQFEWRIWYDMISAADIAVGLSLLLKERTLLEQVNSNPQSEFRRVCHPVRSLCALRFRDRNVIVRVLSVLKPVPLHVSFSRVICCPQKCPRLCWLDLW
jgi:hypothetical protein